MARPRETSAAAWAAFAAGPGWRRYFRSSDSSAAIAEAAWAYASAVRTALAAVPAALLVAREPNRHRADEGHEPEAGPDYRPSIPRA